MSNHLYLAGIKVLRGTNEEMPAELAGAVASCFAAGHDYQAAVRSSVWALERMGFEFASVVGDVVEVPVERWDDYVAEVWSDAADLLPRQADLPEILKEGGVFFGPFAGFED
jgi:hypothetical protein